MRGTRVGLDKVGRPGLPTKKENLGRSSWSIVFVDGGREVGLDKDGRPRLSTKTADQEGMVFSNRYSNFGLASLVSAPFMALRLFNTLSRTVEEFVPLDPGGRLVRMYCCGPTIYDFGH